MKTLYFLTSYDKNTDVQVERTPVPSTMFREAVKFLKSEGDCLQITPELYKRLNTDTGLTLDLTKADFFVERSGDYILKYG